MPARRTGSNQAQSGSHETAAAPATQPAKKPMRALRAFFSSSLASFVSGSPGDRVSKSESTQLVKLPVITAVDGARGTASLKSANWHAIADTAIIAVTT